MFHSLHFLLGYKRVNHHSPLLIHLSLVSLRQSIDIGLKQQCPRLNLKVSKHLSKLSRTPSLQKIGLRTKSHIFPWSERTYCDPVPDVVPIRLPPDLQKEGDTQHYPGPRGLIVTPLVSPTYTGR